jgi:hypothetical protein
MQPFSYTGLKIVQDQKIAEALKHHRFSTEPDAKKPGLFHALGVFLARFAIHSVQKPEATLPDCSWEVQERVS